MVLVVKRAICVITQPLREYSELSSCTTDAFQYTVFPLAWFRAGVRKQPAFLKTQTASDILPDTFRSHPACGSGRRNYPNRCADGGTGQPDPGHQQLLPPSLGSRSIWEVKSDHSLVLVSFKWKSVEFEKHTSLQESRGDYSREGNQSGFPVIWLYHIPRDLSLEK